MAEFTDIKNLQNLRDNDEAREEIESAALPQEEYIDADRFVNGIVKPIIELQNDAKKNVKVVKFNNVSYQPDENGVVSFNQMVDSDTYAIKLATDIDADAHYTVKTGMQLVVNIRYMALKITTAGDRVNYRDVPGTLTVTHSSDGVTYGEAVYTQTVTSLAENSTEYPIAIDLGDFAEAGDNYIRILASSSYTDENGVERTFQNSVIFSVRAIALEVKNVTKWSQPILAGKDNSTFNMQLQVMGAAEKTLHIEIQGSSSVYTIEQTFTAEQQYTAANPYLVSQPETMAGILSHGVHTVTCWLTCYDGKGGTLQSDKVQNRFMVVNPTTPGADLTRAYLLLQGVVENAVNYVRSTLTHYGVFIPASAENPSAHSDKTQLVSLRVTDSADNDTDYKTEYYRSEEQLQSGVEYTLDTTIEIENTTGGAAPKQYDAYLRVFRYKDDGNVVNYMNESFSKKYDHIVFDNTNDYSPVAGADLYINPKIRNNSEADWQSIRNQAHGTTVPSVWNGFNGIGDAWVTDSSNQKVLRVLAGQSLTIQYDPWEEFSSNAQTMMTFELDFCIRNITQEDEPVFEISQEVGASNTLIGLRLLPLEGYLKTVSLQNKDDQNFHWEEDVRNHLVITINPTVTPKADDELSWQDPSSFGTPSSLALCKVWLNGKCEREMVYDISKLGEWIQGSGHGGMRIGNPHADIDIYSIRCYRGLALSEQNVRQNRVAALPTAEKKNSFREENDILDGNGRISYSKVLAKGKRCLTLVGQDNYKVNQDKKKGYACYLKIDYFDDRGNYVPVLSGTIGKASYEAYLRDKSVKCLFNTYQGSTAGTYWDQNEQVKTDNISYTIRVKFLSLHSDFGWKASMSDYTEDTQAECPLFLGDTQVQGAAVADMSEADREKLVIEVNDGWIDGNGMYHGSFYTSAIGAAKATKLVNKINYASPMQSHKMGATRLYNDIMMRVTGGMQLHKDNPAARFAVLEDSFFFFTQYEGQTSPEYRGLSTFGSGKADKPTWGYDKKKYPNMAMFEGANNNLPLCDFRVPFDGNVIYEPDKESWCYNGVASFEYDLGKTQVVGQDSDGNDLEAPTAAIERIAKRYINFIYCHNVRIECYNGSYSEFDREYASMLQHYEETKSEEDAAKIQQWQTKQWWMRTGSTQFCLYRYDYVSASWVDAGTFDTEEDGLYKEGVRNLSTDGMTAAAYEKWKSSDDNGNYTVLNRMFRAAIAKHASDNFGMVAHAQNHQTHYNLINYTCAGTDNCSKNTYYVIDPETGLIWLYQDDLDTLFATDNNGRQTKVYFLDRIHDTEDYENGYKTQEDYEGKASALFDLIECMWEENGQQLRNNMRSILSAMCELVSASDDLPELSDTQKSTPWGCIHKYFFSIQRYFPAVAFNEQARLRYEWPKSFGFRSQGAQSRSIDPITQQVGSQLEAEMQYMKRRLPLICSYAAWGDFTAIESDKHPTGLNDSVLALAFTPGSGRPGGDYVFQLKPHQWIYPTAFHDRTLVDPHVRVAPGEVYAITSAQSGDISGDSSTGIYGLNYYRSIGNVGDMVVGNASFNVNGSRLTEWIAEPSGSGVADAPFQPKGITFGAANLAKLSLRGCSTISGTLRLDKLQRLESVDLRGTKVEQAVMPQSATLHTVAFGENMTEVSIQSAPSLKSLALEGSRHLASLVVLGSPLADTKSVVQAAEGDTAPLARCEIDNVVWSNFAPSTLRFLADVASCSLDGRISVTEGQNIDSLLKLALLRKFGNVDDETNTLYITYTVRSATGINITTQRFIIAAAGDYPYQCDVIPSMANNFTAVRWSLSENSLGVTVDSDTGVLHAPAIGEESNNPTAVLTVTLTLKDGRAMSSSATLKLFNRIPKLGDWAYYNGEFDSELYDGKTVIGWVYRVTPYDKLPSDLLNMYLENADTKKAYDEGRKLYEVLIESADDVSMQTSDNASSFDIFVWGVQSDSAATNGFTNDELQAMADAVGTSPDSITDIPALQNCTVRALKDENGEDTLYIHDVNAYDDSTEDGFPEYTGNVMPNRFDGRKDTLNIVEHANNILEKYVASGIMTTEDGKNIFDYLPSGRDHIAPQSLAELADLYVALGNMGGANRWRQMAYAAAYATVLFEPQKGGKSIEGLHESFSKGRWYLNGSGDLYRLYVFFRNSRNYQPADEGTPVAAYSDENNSLRPTEPTDARRPLYANLLARAAAKKLTCPVRMPRQGYRWSATEYTSYNAWFCKVGNGGTWSYSKSYSMVVRPVVAFDFVL